MASVALDSNTEQPVFGHSIHHRPRRTWEA
jgi:hypothetical protein